jgi:hypothetical protein
MESDFRYYSRRAAEERRRAERAITSAARERHSELADLFTLKARRERPDPPRTHARQAEPSHAAGA